MRFLVLFLSVAIATLLVSPPVSAQQCIAVDHAVEDQVALNSFWGTRIPLCQIPPEGLQLFHPKQEPGCAAGDLSIERLLERIPTVLDRSRTS